MGGDEGELEAAGEEAEHQEHVGAVPERFGQRLPDRLVRHRAGPDDVGVAPPGRVASASDSGSDHEDREGEDHQGLMPAEGCRSGRCRWREQKLPERSGCRAGPERHGPAFLGQQLGEGAQNEVERTPGEPKPISTPAPRVQHARVVA